MTFKRIAEERLSYWKSSETRKPLVIRGARQVGKTTLVRDFCRTYKHSILLNLERSDDRSYFEQYTDVGTLTEALFIAHGIPSANAADTLLFIDEIQECPAAIQQLRYFYEDMPRLHVISAGSLLEFALQKVKSFPVGRVEFLYLHPLNFPEYLTAIGREDLVAQLTAVPVKPAAHTVLMDIFNRYVITGGMPEVVKTDIRKKSLSDLTRVYEGIWATYKNDIEKYTSNPTERKIIRHIMDTAPLYVDERVKFQGFGNSNYRSREVGEAFRTLHDARIIRLIYPTTDVQPPLRPDLKKSPRLQFLDTGLVNYSLNIQAEMLAMDDLSNAYKGSIIPHIIAQEVSALQNQRDIVPIFWVREKSQSQAEVDMLYTSGSNVVPVEIKSGATGSLRSLHQFIEISGVRHAVRIYGGSFSVIQTQTPNKQPYTLMNLPYYLGSQLPAYIAWFLQQ
ncbi:ATP-binding protein [Pedobacter sp. BS3]|uniref:ATP-binding protein n=1 Tax=Pedobacter sp. BS3 TaxID=2567937 RepID=UPI0011F04671|nr:AAA family ATPase [Pedobacter sp. BS3]TZF84026.1 ATP-binding protein [Pedobacter sp. BS3]